MAMNMLLIQKDIMVNLKNVKDNQICISIKLFLLNALVILLKKNT